MSDPTPATDRPPLDLDAIQRTVVYLKNIFGNPGTTPDDWWINQVYQVAFLLEVPELRAEVAALRAELDAARAKALAEMREGVTFALDFNAFLAWHWKARGADVYVNVAMFNAFSDYLRAVLNDAA